jgi:CrcB protein
MVPKVDSLFQKKFSQQWQVRAKASPGCHQISMQNHMANIFAVALGGAIGSLGRYTITLIASRITSIDFPLGTLTANIGGCLLIGLCWSMFDKIHISHEFRLFLFTGVFGGFTTFSTFARESMQFLKIGDMLNGLSYVLLSNILGLAAVAAGYYLGERVFRF